MCGPYLDPDSKKSVLVLLGVTNGIVVWEGGRQLKVLLILFYFLVLTG